MIMESRPALWGSPPAICGPELTGEIRDAVKAVSDRILVEASGGIGIDDIPSYIGKADIVSLGCITHSAVASMFSMDVNRGRQTDYTEKED